MARKTTALFASALPPTTRPAIRTLSPCLNEAPRADIAQLFRDRFKGERVRSQRTKGKRCFCSRWRKFHNSGVTRMERVLDPGKEVALLIKGKCIFFEIAGDECAFTPGGRDFHDRRAQHDKEVAGGVECQTGEGSSRRERGERASTSIGSEFQNRTRARRINCGVKISQPVKDK